MNTPYTFIFFGITGSGKGTQVELLQAYLKSKDPLFESVYAYPGGEYRKLVEGDTYVGRLIKESLDKGNLQPNFLTTSIVTGILIDNLTESKSIIFDGYPRRVAQSEATESMLEFYNRNDIKIIYIELTKEEGIRRMKNRGRADDTEEGIAKRFDEYVNNVVPSMDYFKDKSGYTLYTINGAQSIEDVHKELIAKLGL